MVEAAIGAILLSALSAFMLVRYSQTHIRYSADEVGGPQKFHHLPTPRVGGVAIFAGLILGFALLASHGHLKITEVACLTLSMLPVFAIGLTEDLTKRVTPRTRLLASFIAAAIAFWLLQVELRRLDVPFLDPLLQMTPIALVVSVICVAGLVHAVNIIDGYNGLAPGVAVIILLGLGYVGYQVHDQYVVALCAVSAASILGFLICNYPSGSIFAGDSGAYLIGFLIGLISVLLVTRNHQVSAWCPMLFAIYPVWETLFSIYRKKFLRGHSPNMPDGLHLHMLVYKRLVRFGAGTVLPTHRIVRNSQTSPYFWLLTTLSAIPAIVFWNHTALLMGFCVAFAFLYCRLYWSIVHFRSPKWLYRRIRLPVSDAVEAKVGLPVR